MTWLLLLTACVLTCLGQIAQKFAVEQWQSDLSPLAAAVRSPWLWLAALCLGVGLLVWLMVLQRLEVGIAYPMLGLNFVLITLTGRYLFNEHVDSRHWCGVALILTGVALLGGQA